MTTGNQVTDPSRCTHCGALVQGSWKHCPECGLANVTDAKPRKIADKNPIFDGELDDGDIDITPQIRAKYAIEMRVTGAVMIVLGLLAFAGVLFSLLYSAEHVDVVEINEYRFYTWVAIACGGIMALMAGVIVVTIPSKDGATSAVTIALGSMLSVALGALFTIILILVIILAMIVGFINSCMNMCQPS